MVVGQRGRAAAGAVLLALALAACTANPPPPIESTDSPRTTAVQPTRNTIVVAIDEVGVGFNPHLLADQSPTNAAVSTLVLPSPFRPIASATRPGATDWVPDTSVLVSADVTATDPFTITYQLRNEAQWSDGAPIAAEDFRYLWQQMINDPGVVDPAGYELISDVSSSGGGKTVTVTMREPYPAWRELFTDLVPAHLLKDAPGGFAQGLTETIPVSGAHFHIRSIDRGRDEILLERNDRFWDQPATPDQILMRRGGTSAQLADSLRSDDAHVAEVHGGEATRAQLSAIPGVRTGNVFQPRVLQVTLNGRVPALGDVAVRGALLGLLDPELLATVAAGSASSSTPARAQVLAPSDPGYAPTAPERLGADAARAQLAAAGYDLVPYGTTPTPSPTAVASPTLTAPPTLTVAPGPTLAMRIGAPQNDDTAVAVANSVADLWRNAGIDATVQQLPSDDLFGSELAEGNLDAVVGWVRAGSDPATSLASRFGCPTSVSPAPADDGDSAVNAPSNLSGVCDPVLQPAIDAALRGEGDVAAVIAEAEPALWRLATVLPVIQDTTVVAAGPGVSGVSLTGPIQTGIFADAVGWTRVPQ
ncbi:MAG TPA: ABC transporter family substrate-binding protein [Aldersonia sp.]